MTYENLSPLFNAVIVELHHSLEGKNMKKTSKKTALTQAVEEYASRSSIHGIGYAFDRELSVVDRLLWLLVVVAFLGIAAALSWNLWSQWDIEQVVKPN